MEVVDADVSDQGNFSLLKIKPECRQKYGGNEQIAGCLKRLSSNPQKKDSQMMEMMGHMLQEKKVRELMIANVTEEALDYIKKAKPKKF